MNVEGLYNEVGYVLFTYPDDSVLLVRTTLSDLILEDVLKDRPEGCLYDLNRKRWIPIPELTEVEMSVHRSKPEVGGLNEFINRFI